MEFERRQKERELRERMHRLNMLYYIANEPIELYQSDPGGSDMHQIFDWAENCQ